MKDTSTLRTASATVHARPEWLTNLGVIENLTEAEPHWRALQADGAVSTPYQNFDFLSSWHREVGEPQGTRPLIIVGFDSLGKEQFLLPLGVSRAGPLQMVQFLGGKHANFNFGIWKKTAASSASADDLQFILRHIAATRHRPDVLALHSQPRAWLGLDNPFVRLPHRPSADDSARLVVDAPGPELIEREVGTATRGRLRTKERKLQKLPGYRYFQATEPGEVDLLLEQFFALKTVHMTAQGIPNVFADDAVKAFLRSASHSGLEARRPAIELHGLKCDDELLALFGALTDGQSLSVMINTYTLSQNGRHSPGLILILDMIQACADRGIKSFDLGVGGAQYKSWFCKQPIWLFDSFLPLTAIGRLSSVGLNTMYALKREVKASPTLSGAYRGLRKMLSHAGV